MPRKTTSDSQPTPRQKKTRAASGSAKEAPVTKQQKPVFSVGTLFTLVLLAALLALAIYLNQNKDVSPEETPTTAVTNLFPATDGTPSSIEVKPAEGEAVRIVRNEENVWVLELPYETEADQGFAEAAATQVSAIREISTVQGELSDFGLDSPDYVVTVKFASGKTHTLEIGDLTPSNSGFYVRIDKDRIVVAGMSGLDALLQLQSSPPYLNTPTPTPTEPPPTETPTPAPPTETATPEASVTPTP